MQRIEVNGLVYEFKDDMALMSLLDENADRVYEGTATGKALPNDPLTPEELREMDGEPVWDKSLRTWGLVVGDFILYRNGEKLPIVGNMYRRRKPEGD